MFSQQIFKGNNKVIELKTKSGSSKLSPISKSIYSQGKQNKNKTNTEVNINSLVRISLLFENDCTNFNDNNILSDVSKITENIFTAFIKIDDLPLLENIKCLKFADIGEKLKLEVNNARNLTFTDAVHLGTDLNQSYKGTGVIVGIIDVGFDYTHPNFKDSNGNLRISRVWERKNSLGTPPINLGFSYGTELVGSSAILNKMRDTVNVSHGTHVAGTASGTGTGDPSLLRGIAPDSEIVLVSNFDKVNATDNNYIDAISYIKNYAKEVNKPAVINMSFGREIGPHDGTTIEEKAINEIANNKGLVLVAAAGNDGGMKNHALLSFSSNDPKYLITDVKKLENQPQSIDDITLIDIWSQNTGLSGAFDIQIGIYNLISKTIVSSQIISGQINGTFKNSFVLEDNEKDNYLISLESQLNPLNNKLNLNIGAYTNNSDVDDKLIISLKSNNNQIHSWCNICDFNNPEGFNFTEGDDYFTVGSPGTATGIVTVGSYNAYEVSDEEDYSGVKGKLSTFSSKGPRTDFWIKPTVTGPGNRIVSSLSSFDANYQTGGNFFSDVTNTFGNHTYGKMQGTSMSAPVVSGIIALWLQANPNLTTNEVLEIIGSSSIKDDDVTESFDFYGTSYSTPPNVKWGFGKINALEGMNLIESALNIENLNKHSKINAYPNPFSNQLTIESNEPIYKIEIYNLLGQKVKNIALDNLSNKKTIIDLSTMGFGNYFAKVFSFKNICTVKLIKK